MEPATALGAGCVDRVGTCIVMAIWSSRWRGVGSVTPAAAPCSPQSRLPRWHD